MLARLSAFGCGLIPAEADTAVLSSSMVSIQHRNDCEPELNTSWVSFGRISRSESGQARELPSATWPAVLPGSASSCSGWHLALPRRRTTGLADGRPLAAQLAATAHHRRQRAKSSLSGVPS